MSKKTFDYAYYGMLIALLVGWVIFGIVSMHRDNIFSQHCEAAGGVVSGDGCFRRDVFVGPSIQE